MLTLGLLRAPWLKVDYPDIPAIGRFESDYFQPETGSRTTRIRRSPTPGPRIASGPRGSSRPSPTTGRARSSAPRSFSDPRATDYLTETLLARKRKVLASWLNGTNPSWTRRWTRDGLLTFENAAERAGVGPAAEGYTIEWAAFDNAAGDDRARRSEAARHDAARAGAGGAAGGAPRVPLGAGRAPRTRITRRGPSR